MNHRHLLLKFTLLLMAGFFNFTVCGQPTGPDAGVSTLKNLIPPSPNASSIAKYGSWPVNLYTGLPNINIPIYELKGRNLSVPISLNYHAAGNKVGDIASWVGLGWSLQAGGVISRSVKGLPDDDATYSLASAFSNPNDLSSSVSAGILSQDVVASAKNNADTQHDMYSFSAMGKSYKLLLKADGTVLTMPYTNVKISANPIVGNAAAKANNSWTVILEDGTQLLFGGSANFTEFTSNINFPTGDGPGVQYTSSWYLNTIISTTADTIFFKYTAQPTNIEQDSYFSQSDYLETLTTTIEPECSYVLDGGLSSTTALQNVTALNLSSIESGLGRVDFLLNPTERLDLKGGYSLSEIKVFSKLANQYIEDYLFNYSFTTAVAGNALLTGSTNTSYWNYRLHLNGLQRNDMVNLTATPQKWSFDYNPQNLPSRRSYAQDHWGFFNGATSNTTLLPPLYFQVPSFDLPGGTKNDGKGFMPGLHNLGGIRTVNPSYLQAEMLTAIHYPTGGSSKFVYEPNGYLVSQEVFSTSNPILSLNLTQASNSPTTKTATITVTKPQYVGLSVSSTISQGVKNDQPGANIVATITDQGGNDVIAVTSVNNSSSQWYDLRSAGTYTFKITTNVPGSEFTSSSTYITASATLTYQLSLGTQSVTQYVGGLRIQSMADNDVNSTVDINQRFFQYASPLVINPIDPVSDYLTTIVRQAYYSGDGESCSYNRNIRNTSTKFSLGDIEGGTVGYGQVTTLYGINGANGSSVSIFNSEPDAYPTQASLFPYPAPDSRDWRRGLLVQQSDYDASQRLLKTVTNAYSFNTIGQIVGFKAGYSQLLDPHFCTDQYQNCGITKMYCYTTCEQVKHLSTSETVYSNTTPDYETTSTTYNYDNAANTQPTSMVKVNSKGDAILIYNRTALEKTDINNSLPLSPTSSAAIDAMVTRNMVNITVESEKYVKTVLMSRMLTNFKVQSNNFVQQDNITAQILNNLPEQRIQFTGYDGKGNLTEQLKTNDAKEVYLYGYKSHYPVAKLFNTTYATAIGYINQNILDYPVDDASLRTQLNNLRNIPGALVTTYTYAPLIGVTSETDPTGKTTFYEYDGFNRLKNIKDYQGNIIKNYQYNYANSCGANCIVLPLQTYSGSNTIGYPVGVFNVNAQLLGQATTQAQYISLWNANAANQAKGVLSAGGDVLHFNFAPGAGQTTPSIIGLRYYQFDFAYTTIDAIRNLNGAYVDFGDGNKMKLGTNLKDVSVTLAPNTTMNFFPLSDPYDPHDVPYFFHTYPDNSIKTITIYHNDSYDYELFGLDNLNNPSTSLTKVSNLRGNLPQYMTRIYSSGAQISSFTSFANVANWPTITSIKSWGGGNGDGVTPSMNLGYAQDFMINNKGLENITTDQYGYYRNGYRDLTFKITRLKSDWNTYFTQLNTLQVNEDHWNHEDLSNFKKLSKFGLTATTQNHLDDVNSPLIPLASSVMDNAVIQIAAGAGSSGVVNGIIYFNAGGGVFTSASLPARNQLKAAGWTIYIDGVVQ